MTAKGRLRDNTIKGWLIVMLILFLSFKSCVVHSQALPAWIPDSRYPAYPYLLTDSTGKKIDKPIYVGYEVALSAPAYCLKSDLTVLNRIRVNSLGVSAGLVVGNKFGKIKGGAGYHYSDASVPYTFDLLTGGLSANAYLLRIGNVKYHTIEPYVIGGISQQHVKFYGNYLDQNLTRNYSLSEEPFLGKLITTQFNVGFGAEYQLENDHGDFIHLFAEATYGIPVAARSTREVFENTHLINPVSISVGLSFGQIKQRGE